MQRMNGRKIEMMMTDKMLKRIEKLQKRHGMTRSEVIRRLCHYSLETYDDFESVGVPQAVELARKLKGEFGKMKVQLSLF